MRPSRGLRIARYPSFEASALIERLSLRTLHHPRADELNLPEVLHALSDPVRLEIVRTLAEREEQACSALEASVSKSTLSHHFRVLRESGVLTIRREGKELLNSIRVEDLDARFPGLLPAVIGAIATPRATKR